MEFFELNFMINTKITIIEAHDLSFKISKYKSVMIEKVHIR